MTEAERSEVESWFDCVARKPYRSPLVVDERFYALLRKYAASRDELLGFTASPGSNLMCMGRLVACVPDWELPFGEEIGD